MSLKTAAVTAVAEYASAVAIAVLMYAGIAARSAPVTPLLVSKRLKHVATGIQPVVNMPRLAISRETATAIVGCLVVVWKFLSPFHGFVFVLVLFRGPMAHGYMLCPLRGQVVPQ